MDFSKLTTNNWIAVGGGLVALISGFLPWVDYFGVTSDSGFGRGFFGPIGILLVVAGAVVLLLKIMDMNDVKLQGLSAEQLAMVVAAVGTLFILIAVIFIPDGGANIGGIDVVSRGWGAFVGLIAGAATTVGAFLSAKDEGIGLPSADDFTGGGGGDGGATNF